MTIDIEKLAKEAGCERYDLGKREAYLNQARFTFDSSQLKQFAEAVLEDKEREIAELKEIIESIAELYSAAVEQIMRLQNDCL